MGSARLEISFESKVARHESVALVESVGVGSLDIRGELDAIATCLLGSVDSGIEELFTDALSTKVRMDVQGLHLRAKAAASLEMSEHDELAHPYDLAIKLSYEDFASA